MSDGEDEQSPEPKFWLEFRTFDDGLPPVTGTTLAPPFDYFPQFAQLPPELRVKIWSYLIQPRVVVVSCLQRDEHLAARRRALRDRTAPRPGSRVGPPVLLEVSRETRRLAQGHYERAFGWRISKLLSDTPARGPAHTWFNFALDALYLTGELEAFDEFGFNTPMAYFLRAEDTRRVRRAACAFAAVGWPGLESDQVFACLWHVVDRFPAVRRLLLAVGERDEDEPGAGGRLMSTDNVMQKIWDGWTGTLKGSRGADVKMLLVREKDLAEAVANEQLETVGL